MGYLVIEGYEFGLSWPTFYKPLLAYPDPLVVLYVLYNGTQSVCFRIFPITEVRLTGQVFHCDGSCRWKSCFLTSSWGSSWTLFLSVSWQAFPSATSVPVKRERSVKLHGENAHFVFRLYNPCVWMPRMGTLGALKNVGACMEVIWQIKSVNPMFWIYIVWTCTEVFAKWSLPVIQSYCLNNE